MKREELKDSIPSSYNEDEKEEIVLLFIQLANLYLDLEPED